MDLEVLHLLCHEQESSSRPLQRNRRSQGGKNLFYMQESRKRASSASVIWHVVLFRQFRTDRPHGEGPNGERERSLGEANQNSSCCILPNFHGSGKELSANKRRRIDRATPGEV